MVIIIIITPIGLLVILCTDTERTYPRSEFVLFNRPSILTMRCVRNDKCRPTFVVALFIVCSISLSVFNFDNLAFVEAKTVPIHRLILTKIPRPSISVSISHDVLHINKIRIV